MRAGDSVCLANGVVFKEQLLYAVLLLQIRHRKFLLMLVAQVFSQHRILADPVFKTGFREITGLQLTLGGR